MELKNFFAQDDQGNKLPGAQCYLYLRGTESPAPGALKASGVPLETPFTADSNGLIQLAAPNGLYDLRVTSGGRDYRIRLQFNDVSESVLSAQVAAQQAETARDSAHLFAGLKDDIAHGLATTTSGQNFATFSPGSDLYLILYKNNAGVPVEVGSHPSAKALIQAMLTTGEKIASADFVPLGQVFNGATYVTSAGKIVGFAIPAGSMGNTSYATYLVQPSAGAIAKLVGSTIRLKIVCDATANFLSEKVSSTVMASVYRGGVPTNVGTLARNEQIGTKLYREVLYTVTATDQKFGVTLQVQGGSGTNAHSVTLASVSYSVESWAGKDVTAGDFMLEQQVAPLAATATAAANSASSAATAAAAADAKASKGLLTFGEKLASAEFVPVGQVFNGATYVTSGGKIVGFAIPAGSIGNTSYASYLMQPAAAVLAKLVGSTIRLKLVCDATAGFLAEKVSSVVLASVYRAGVSSNIGTLVRNEQVGTKLYREVLYTVTAADQKFGITLQVIGGSGTNAHSVTGASVSYAIESWVADGPNAGDFILDQRLLPLDASIAAAVAATDAKVAKAALSSGEKLATTEFAPVGQMFNGAAFTTSAGKIVGFTIPAGSMGNTSYAAFHISPSAAAIAKLVGSTIRLKIVADATAGFLAGKVSSSLIASVYRAGISSNVGTLARNEQIGTKLYREVLYTVTDVDQKFGIMLQIQGGSGTNAHSVQVTSVTYAVESWAGDGPTAADFMLSQQLAPFAQASGTITKVTVKPDGTGDYLSPMLAVAGISDASAAKAYDLSIAPGRYTDQDWSNKDYVHLIGEDRERTTIAGELPDNYDPASIQYVETMWMNGEAHLANLTITAKNMRYPLHSDSSGVNKNITQIIENCHIEHFGNQGAIDYQTNNGGSPSLVWPNTTAFGFGSSSGLILKAIRSTFKSPTVAMYVHTREHFEKPCITMLDNCQCIATNDDGVAVRIQPLGSLRNDIFQINNTELVGDIDYIPSPWIPTALKDQPASHAEVSVIGAGNSPAVFTVAEFGKALKIESASTLDTSAVVVTGSAVAVIFGEVIAMPGRGGIKGYSYGWADISGGGVGLNKDVFITSLGQRLGNCTAVNKTLNVSVDGGAPMVVTFNQDYTAQSNTTILAAINAVLGSAAVATAYNIGGRYRPKFSDEELALKNTSAVGILMGSALAYDGHFKKVRKMTSTDAPALFAGIAWEDIYPGQYGRVKTCGYLPVADLLGTVGALTFGQPLYIDPAKPGQLITTVGANPIMSAIRANAVEVAPK